MTPAETREPAPEGTCPGCQTAGLTCGRSLCQACGALQALGRLADPQAGGKAG